MPFVMRGDSHIVLPVDVEGDDQRYVRLLLDVRLADGLRDHAIAGDLHGRFQYRFTRQGKHVLEFEGEAGEGIFASLSTLHTWHHIQFRFPLGDAVPGPLIIGAHSTNGGSSFLAPMRGAIRNISFFVGSKRMHWWPIHEGQGLAVHDMVGEAHGTITKGLGAWRIETSPTAPPVENMSAGMMRSMV